MDVAAARTSTPGGVPASIRDVNETPPSDVDVKAEFDRAVALHQARRLVEAEAIYRRILACRPRDPGALHLLGVVDIQRGRPAAALENIAAAMAINPQAAPFHGNYATALQALGRLDEAQTHYQEAVRLDPDYADAHNNLGVLLEKRARQRDAIAAYRAALKARPDFAEAHQNLGQLLRATGAIDEAITHLREAIRLRPDYAEAHRGLGIALGRQNKVEESIAELRRAIALNPEDAEAHNQLGNRLKQKGRLEEAEASYRRALALQPDLVDAHNNLGNVHFRRGRLDAAEACYRKTLALRADYPDGHGNLGIVHMGRCDYDAAIASLRRALELRPSYPEAGCNLGQALLVLGRFREGWERYEARWKLPNMPARPFRQPCWRGESLLGRTILLHAEQGLGDAIQFVRFVPLIRALGADIVLEAPRELMRLFAPIAVDGVRLVQRDHELPHFDLHCPLLSLPGALGCDLGDIPAAVPYLAADPAAVGQWRARLGGGDRLHVGLVWAGNPQHGNDLNRSFPPLAFRPLLELPGISFHSLQKQQRPGDAAHLAQLGTVHDHAAELGDFCDTAAALSALDLLIAADTSVVHLAGALARPVWTLLPFSPDWRWLIGRNDSPWYPTMRLYRQSQARDWEGVMRRVAVDLRDYVR